MTVDGWAEMLEITSLVNDCEHWRTLGFHYNWHWFWDLGTGEIGNNGIHGLDVARHVLGVNAPTRISCAGGKYAYDDDQQTPDTQIAPSTFRQARAARRVVRSCGNIGYGKRRGRRGCRLV
jgi:predicted dehydrogenase